VPMPSPAQLEEPVLRLQTAAQDQMTQEWTSLKHDAAAVQSTLLSCVPREPREKK